MQHSDTGPGEGHLWQRRSTDHPSRRFGDRLPEGGGTLERDGSAGDPPWVPRENVDTLIDALELIASVLPAGHELFTLIADLDGEASDLIVRDSDGETHVVLGLGAARHRQLGALLAALRDNDSGSPAGFPSGAGAEAPPTAAEPASPPETSYRAIVEQSPVPLIVIGTDGMIEYASPAVVTTLGMREPAQLTGLPIAAFVHPDDRDRLPGSAMQLPTRGALTVRLSRWDGGYIPTQIAARASPGREGLILALQPAQTSYLGFEEVLISERRQRSLADAADCGTVLLTGEPEAFGHVLECNQAFGRIVGASPGELAGRAIWDLIARVDTRRVREAFGRVVAGDGSRRLEVQLAGDGHRRAELVINVDRSSGDPPTQMTVRARDITDQVGTIRELHRTIERHERENTELGEFARITAHDLMLPLRAIASLVDLMAPDVDPVSADVLEAVQSAIARMIAMVDSALGFAQAQTQQLGREPVDLNDVVKDVTATLSADIAASDATLTLHRLPVVMGDRPQLERLFLCLLTNALRYGGDAAPRIALAAEQDGETWQITVADQGIGVDPASRERIFGLFERRATATEGAAYGGIGLATCRRVVELHHGRIWVEPNTPRGSIFTFTLPAAAP